MKREPWVINANLTIVFCNKCTIGYDSKKQHTCSPELLEHLADKQKR